MNETTAPATQRNAVSLSSRERMFVASDLLPPCDFIALLFTAYASSLLYSLLSSMTAHEALATLFTPSWTGRGGMALIGALLAPFILYDRNFAADAAQGKAFALIGSYALRSFATALAVLLVGGAARVSDNLPAAWLLLWLGCSLALTAAMRWLVARHVRSLHHRGALTESIAVVGAGPIADGLNHHLRKTKAHNIELLGIFDDIVDTSRAGENSTAWPVHTLDRLMELSKTRNIDWIVITVPEGEKQRLQSLIQRLKVLSIPIALCPQDLALQTASRTVDYVGNGMPAFLLADRPIKRWNVFLKAAEDFVLSLILTLLALPVLLLIALAIRLDSPGPVIFKQRRHAFNNTEFFIYKFRTMRWQPRRTGDQLQQTQRNDQRVTRIGRFLRESSLDELPQLLNVLKGEMSLVGPRPHAVDMRTENRLGTEITDCYAHRHRVKPGLTGWSQVNGARGATDTTAQLQRRIELDLYYIDHWSLWLDLKILLMTFLVVLKKTNAY